MSTPTPAPLTDEQIGNSPADEVQLDDDVRALVEGESMPEEAAWAIIAAVIAKARREEREAASRHLRYIVAHAHGIGDDFADGIQHAISVIDLRDWEATDGPR